MRSLLFIFISMFLFLSCSRPQNFEYVQPAPIKVQSNNLGALQGTITNATGSGLVGVTVTVHDGGDSAPAVSVATDANGNYSIAGLPPGTLTVDLRASGYISINAIATVILLNETTTLDRSLVIDPGGLQGTVTNIATGAPISGVAVSVHVGNDSGSIVASAVTNASGQYTVGSLPPGAYAVDFVINGFYPVLGVGTTVASAQNTTLNEALTPIVGNLQINVSDSASGLPLPNVAINVHSGSESGPVVDSGTTNAAGSLTIASLPAGTYAVDLSLTGYSPLVGIPATIVGGQTTTLNELMTSVYGSLVGTVSNALTDAALAGVTVSIHPGSETAPVSATVQTATDGTYSFPGLAAGSYAVDFSLAGFRPITGVVITITGGRVTTLNEMMIPLPSALQGNVTKAVDGTPLPGVLVSVHPGTESAPVQTTATTDADGNYAFQTLAPGTYAVDFTLNGYIPIMGAATLIVQGQTTILNESMTVSLQPGQFRMVLNWCSQRTGAVRDIDSYLLTPGVTQPIDYDHQIGAGANLDHDVTQWVGPETITITQLQATGTYTYYINNYNIRCDTSALGNSSAVVNLYNGNSLVKTYTIPPGTGITYELFQIVNGQVVDVNMYTNSLFIEPNSECITQPTNSPSVRKN